MVIGYLALFFVLLSLLYLIAEASILRERFYGNIPYRAKEKFLEKRVPLPLGVIVVCLVIIWIVFVH